MPHRSTHVPRGHELTVLPDRHETRDADFTNVTAMSWPGVAVHPRYADVANDPDRLEGRMMRDIAGCSYEVLARLSWLLAEGTSLPPRSSS
jgi:hypothetical protein